MSGRRRYIRSHVESLGSVRISRAVTIEGDEKGAGLAVLSCTLFPVGTDLTLSLATTSSIEELSVRVTAAEPRVVNGSMRHRLQLAILSARPKAPATISDAERD